MARGCRGCHGALAHHQALARLGVATVLAALVCLVLTAYGRSSAYVPRVGTWTRGRGSGRQAQPMLTNRAARGPQGPPPALGTISLAPLDTIVDGQLASLKGLVESDTGKTVASVIGGERFESVKTSVLGIAFAVIPEAVTAWLDPDRLTPRWEFQLDMLAVDVLLFSLVYRYALREGDDNAMQKLGVISAFVLPRALFLVEMPAECTPAPLSCGPPLGYFSWPMLVQVAKQLAIGGVTLGAALYGLERAFGVGLIRRFGCSQSTNQVEEQAEVEGGVCPGDDAWTPRSGGHSEPMRGGTWLAD
eukprot:CAMPEP_0179093148 /NCGR_PEP_ID=MMETSP0796-20121207/42641_1 /TAXON_ID=73915 /ORGANISM="Pyrodinium bahamense, Strain pbaha01" /LENGTH=303 /DNA_ID=CAMNT_0020790771 /DNA_START=12 /DNA_END=921 /DNA_ORIENTATION=+